MKENTVEYCNVGMITMAFFLNNLKEIHVMIPLTHTQRVKWKCATSEQWYATPSASRTVYISRLL